MKKRNRSISKISLIGALIMVLFMVTSTGMSGSYASAQNNSSNMTSATSGSDLDSKMEQLESSNDPTDIATLAYTYGFPLVAAIRTADFATSPDIPPAPGRGPFNTISNFRDFPNASFTDIVRPNVDTLYSVAYFDLSKEPLVLKVPMISDRYYSIQFIDAYSNNFQYVGTRNNDTKGGTYFITGPNWDGIVPSGMKQIKAPTDSGLFAVRVLVKGPDDVNNVHSIQDQFNLSPFSVNSNSSAIIVGGSNSNASEDIPVAPDPALIPTTGIKLYDEISKDMADNTPPQSDSAILVKFKTIGVGLDLKPSHIADDNVKRALEKGITNGEQLIDEKVQNLGTIINGWSISSMNIGNFGTDYLLRAAVAKFGLFANSPQEAVYPTTFKDSQGQNLTGINNYVIHFDKGQLPPVKGFWSLTMYNNKSYLADNPINRYSIGGLTPGLKNNTDGSLDIYIQLDNPGKNKESNWLPAPAGDFSLNMRLYIPEKVVLKGNYQYPPITRTVISHNMPVF